MTGDPAPNVTLGVKPHGTGSEDTPFRRMDKERFAPGGVTRAAPLGLWHAEPAVQRSTKHVSQNDEGEPDRYRPVRLYASATRPFTAILTHRDADIRQLRKT